MTLYDEVTATLAALDLDERDGAASALALAYAAAIDAMDDAERAKLVGTVGPGLLRCLESLGATPASRKAAPAHVSTGGTLAALRAVK